MRIVINGQNESVNSENVDDLVNNLALVREAILVEHNGVALLRAEWQHTALSEGDEIEIESPQGISTDDVVVVT